MGKKVYLLNEQNHYIGEGIEDFGISYVNKTEVAPKQEYLNGEYDVVWNGEEWVYILIPKPEPESEVPELTEEEIKAQELEFEKQRLEELKKFVEEQFPHIWELVEKKLNELGIIQNKNIGEE